MYPDTKHAESAVFEQRGTLEAWDRDYYHPIAERYYDRAISTMLRLVGVEPGAMVLDAGCGPGVHAQLLRSGATEFTYKREIQPQPKLGAWVTVLTEILEAEAKLPRRERRSTQRLFEELLATATTACIAS